MMKFGSDEQKQDIRLVCLGNLAIDRDARLLLVEHSSAFCRARRKWVRLHSGRSQALSGDGLDHQRWCSMEVEKSAEGVLRVQTRRPKPLVARSSLEDFA